MDMMTTIFHKPRPGPGARNGFLVNGFNAPKFRRWVWAWKFFMGLMLGLVLTGQLEFLVIPVPSNCVPSVEKLSPVHRQLKVQNTEQTEAPLFHETTRQR